MHHGPVLSATQSTPSSWLLTPGSGFDWRLHVDPFQTSATTASRGRSEGRGLSDLPADTAEVDNRLRVTGLGKLRPP
jgi:hypothetical protein